MRYHQVVFIASSESFDGLLYVEFYLFFEFLHNAWLTDIEHIYLGASREVFKEPIRLAGDIFVGGLNVRIIFFEMLHSPVWYKEYLHCRLVLRFNFSATNCFMNLGQVAIATAYTATKYTTIIALESGR